MNKEEYSDFLQSMEWKAVRNEYIKNHSVCGLCKRPATEVHHFAYEKGELGYLNTKNLVSLCRSCHREVHLFDKLITRFAGSDLMTPSIIESFRELMDVPEINKLRQEEEYRKAEILTGGYMYRLFFYAPNARKYLFILISLSPEDIRSDILTYVADVFSDNGAAVLERIDAIDKLVEERKKQLEEDCEKIFKVTDERGGSDGNT